MYTTRINMEFELTPAKKAEEKISWWGGASGYEIWDFAKWKFETYLRECPWVWVPYGRLPVRAALKVYGSKSAKTRRYRPTTWCLRLALGGMEQEIAKGKCKSVRQARHLARQAIAATDIPEFLRWAYRECPKVSVYQFRPQRPTIMDLVRAGEPPTYGRREGWYDPLTQQLMKKPNSWEPWLTYCQFDHSEGTYFPDGHYLWIYEYDGAVKVSLYNRSHWSWSSLTDPALTKLAQELPAWHESASNSDQRTGCAVMP